MNASPHDKSTGAYYTPMEVVGELRDWATERMPPGGSTLDPSCGDGRFLKGLDNATGIDVSPDAVVAARANCPGASILEADFFQWCESTSSRFSAVVGNPPFIRYQRFKGEVRDRSRRLAAGVGARISGLASSWASFVVLSGSRLRQHGRMAMVVPAEIGHAVYARDVVRWLVANFSLVRIVAIREKIFPELAEDCWLLFADGFGGCADGITIETRPRFSCAASERRERFAPLAQLQQEQMKIRSFLLSEDEWSLYRRMACSPGVVRLGDAFRLGIGYVTGANSFFHLRPSEAAAWGIDEALLRPAVRANRNLKSSVLSAQDVNSWRVADAEFLLLDLSGVERLPSGVVAYLDSDAGLRARRAYKCRNRNPWWVVPDVAIPCGFLTLMSSKSPRLVRNEAGCVCTNSVQALFRTGEWSVEDVGRAWKSVLTELSCEVEGHPMGAGMLKLEPKEARRVMVPIERTFTADEGRLLQSALNTLRHWRGGSCAEA